MRFLSPRATSLDCLEIVQRFHHVPLCFQPNMAVMLQHYSAEMAADCLDSRICGLSLRKRRNEMVPYVVNAALHTSLFLGSIPSSLPCAQRIARGLRHKPSLSLFPARLHLETSTSGSFARRCGEWDRTACSANAICGFQFASTVAFCLDCQCLRIASR